MIQVPGMEQMILPSAKVNIELGEGAKLYGAGGDGGEGRKTQTNGKNGGNGSSALGIELPLKV